MQFAQMLGVHPVTLSKWERGTAEPGPYNIQQLRLLDGGADQMNEDERNEFLKLVGLGVFVGALAAVIAVALKKKQRWW